MVVYLDIGDVHQLHHIFCCQRDNSKSTFTKNCVFFFAFFKQQIFIRMHGHRHFSMRIMAHFMALIFMFGLAREYLSFQVSSFYVEGQWVGEGAAEWNGWREKMVFIMGRALFSPLYKQLSSKTHSVVFFALSLSLFFSIVASGYLYGHVHCATTIVRYSALLWWAGGRRGGCHATNARGGIKSHEKDLWATKIYVEFWAVSGMRLNIYI